MTIYSHSRLSCYEQCPQKFKLQYIDKVETEVEENVEAFLGSLVHETLEKLYRDLEFQKLNSLDEILVFLESRWHENWSEDIVIVNNEYSQNNYLNMAKKYVSNYYNRYVPFDKDKTIALEQRILIDLDEKGAYKLQGYIDRLTEIKNGFYEIHDYKTNSRLPLADYIKTDRQLALYMIGVKKNYPDVKDVRLIWHFLKFDKEIDSTRTDAELEKLKVDTIELIDKIESDKEFIPNAGYLCDWCEFKSICKQWMHLYKIKEMPENEYLSDSGLVLVNRYAELKTKQKQVNIELDEEIKKIEEALILFAEKEQVDCVFGTKNKVRITESERLCFPSKNSKQRKELEEVLLKYGKLEDVQQLDTTALGKIVQEKKWEIEVLNALKEYIELERSKRLYLSKNKDY